MRIKTDLKAEASTEIFSTDIEDWMSNMYKELENILPAELVKYDEPLSKHCTFKIGGPADVIVFPESVKQLISVILYARLKDVPVTVIGNGSNILFSDKGVRGVVIKLGTRFGGIDIIKREEESSVLRAGAGILLSRLASFAADESLTGLEFAFGIPGSVGGAVLMNAGAYDGEISQCVFRSTYLDINTLETGTKVCADHSFSYRRSSYQEDGHIILSADFTLSIGNKEDILGKMKELTRRRIDKQPLEYPSAGSAFKRPVGNFAGKLVDECGLRGYKHGGAAVSEKHCGFIINAGGATCDDVRHVIEYVQDTVLKQTGILLEPEIRMIGE